MNADTPEPEPDDSEVLLTAPTPWHGVLAPEGIRSGDKRQFAPGSLTWRDLPLPLSWQKVNAPGHDGSIVVGQISSIERGDDGLIHASGVFADTAEADEVVGLLAEGHLRGVSVDVDDAEMAVDDEADGVVFSQGRISGATLCPIPAFTEAFVNIGDPDEPDPMAAAAFRQYDTEERKRLAEEGKALPESLSQVSDELLLAYALNAAKDGVTGQAEESAYTVSRVAVVDNQRGPGPAGLSVGAPHLRHLAADRALAVLGSRHSLEIGVRDPVLAAEGGVPASQPAGLSEVDVLRAAYRLGLDAGSALSSAAADPGVELRVGLLLLADAAGDRPLVVNGETISPHASNLTPFRQYDAETRRRLMDEGKAMRPDGSFPIVDEEDLRNAIQAIGRAADPDAAKAHIEKRAKDLGLEDLIPETWAAGVEEFAVPRGPGDKRGPGWITEPKATRRIHAYWTRPDQPGFRKIAWGTPGDFNRCRRHLAKYIGPVYLNRTCAEWHKDALGFWPAQHKKMLGGSADPIEASIDDCDDCTGSVVLTAAADVVLPGEWFTGPGLPGPTPLTIDGDRVFGHLALFDTCHIGFGEKACVTPPHSPSAYAYFATGSVLTDAGRVPVGQITMNTGHAGLSDDARSAAYHYDHTGSAAADVAVGEDAHGIWFSGALRPGLTDDARRALAAASLSGDWRGIRGNLELVAALAVNVPGFPVPRTSLAAAGGSQTSLVAAGVVDHPSDEPARDLVAAVADEVEARAARRERAGQVIKTVTAIRAVKAMSAMQREN